MKDNKLYKFLRIVFLTLAIISLIFSLSKKFVHAASSESSTVSSYPLPYGVNSGYGYSGSGGDIAQAVDLALNDFRNFQTAYPPSIVYLIEEGEGYYDICVTNGSFLLGVNSNYNYPDYRYLNTISYDWINFNLRGYVYRYSNGAISRVGWSSFNSVSPVNWFIASPTGSYILKKNTSLYGYPLYISSGGYSYNGNDIFVYSSGDEGGFDGPGFGSGTITGEVIDFEGHGFDYDLDISIDLNPLEVLGEEIIDKLDTFKDRVVEGFQVIGGKIDTFKDRVVEGFQTLSSIPSKVSDTYDYITEPFDEEKFTDKFEDMELGQEIATFRTDIESFTGTFNVAPAVADDVRFSIPFTLPYVNQNLEAVIDFSFYDNIRHIVVPFFTVFLIFGMVWSLIRSIPGIIHGTSPDGDS